MLQLVDIEKKIGGEVHLHPLSLSLEKGTFNVLLGPTNAGKTSLMRIMAGLDKPTAGRVIFDGRDVTGLPVSKRKVGMVYQNFINYPNFTVYENIASPMRAAGKPKGEIRKRVEELLETLGLGDQAQKIPSELSGGQQQRTAIGRALANDADLLLLDEPLVNLDYKLREELRDELPGLIRDSEKIIVYSTSDPSEAMILKGTVATLHQGGVYHTGPTLEVYQKPKNLTSASIFSYPPLNRLKVEKRGDAFVFDGGSLPAKGAMGEIKDGSYILAFRAHQFFLEETTNGDCVRLEAEVLFCEISGSEYYVHLDCHGSKWVCQRHEPVDLDTGDKIGVFLDFGQAFLFGENGDLVHTFAE